MEPYTVLVIDDEPVICNGCRSALSDYGYRVETCRGGKQAIDLLLSGGYGIALLDIRLPDIDGMQILRTVKEERPDIHVIMMTGYASVANAVEAMKAGAFDYITKPFSDDELYLVVSKAVENKRLREENRCLRQQLDQQHDFCIGEDPKIRSLFDAVQKVAPTDTTVLICGESGTGKELFARAIHARSKRTARQFIAVDCSAFSSNLLESELFGHVRGAFTGAVLDTAGIFEIADHGTLFLDEVANMDLDIQAKLLRTMESREFKPVGASRFKTSNIRIIAATNQDLKTLVEKGRFREDLYYRLNVFPMFIPPLRQRRADIPRLLYYFLKRYCRRTGKKIDGFSDDALEYLMNYDWPGNVRQLKNMVERLVIIADEPILDYRSLSAHREIKGGSSIHAVPDSLMALKSVKQQVLDRQFGPIEKAFLCKALAAANGNIAEAARRVGMQRSNFSTLMKKRLSKGRDRNANQSGVRAGCQGHPDYRR